MQPVVRDVFPAFSDPLEGTVPWMYQDHLGKVTVGIGNLIDSSAAAWATRDHGAPFVHKADMTTEATRGEVVDEWTRVKNDPALRGKWQLGEHVTNLRLTEQGIANLVTNRLEQFAQALRRVAEFAALDDWPADAALGLLSMAWAMGPHFADGGRWPRFRRACAAGDWLGAAENCTIANGWLRKRNAVNRGLLRNAAWVRSTGADPTALYLAVPGNRPLLQQGMTDDDVAGKGYDDDRSVSTLRDFLDWLGHPADDAPGVFGGSTDAAVRAFQAAEERVATAGGGFAVDGKVGPVTWAALGYVVPRA